MAISDESLFVRDMCSIKPAKNNEQKVSHTSKAKIEVAAGTVSYLFALLCILNVQYARSVVRITVLLKTDH